MFLLQLKVRMSFQVLAEQASLNTIKKN
jgi:hypothetical protein